MASLYDETLDKSEPICERQSAPSAKPPRQDREINCRQIMYDQVDRDIRIRLLESLNLGFALWPLNSRNISGRNPGRSGSVA
jgi:hypothetical protein